MEFNSFYKDKNACIYNLDTKLINFNCRKLLCKSYHLLNKLKAGNNKMMYAQINITNISLPGTVVSMWKYSQQKTHISLKMCHMIEDCLQRRFGDQLPVPCVGVNCYFVNHHSLRLKNRPETIDSDRMNNYYARQNSNCKENIPLIEKFIEYRKRLTRQEKTTINDYYMRFLAITREIV